MRIGVVSDTHNNLTNVAKIVELFNEAGVDRVIHTGDITQAKTLEIFARLDARLYGVFGNNDQGERESLERAAAACDFELRDPPFELTWHERRIVVVHDPLEFAGVLDEHHHLALHGHTHLHRLEQTGERLIFNPGECAGHMPGYNAVGVVNLGDLETELLRF